MMLEKTRSRSRLKKIKKPPKKRKPLPRKSKFHAQDNPTKIYSKTRSETEIRACAEAYRARRLASPTPQESECEEIIRELGEEYEREKIFYYADRFSIFDFFVTKSSLCIEVDGNAHKQQHTFDMGRDAYFTGQNIRTLRIKNEEFKDKEAVKAKIKGEIDKSSMQV